MPDHVSIRQRRYGLRHGVSRYPFARRNAVDNSPIKAYWIPLLPLLAIFFCSLVA